MKKITLLILSSIILILLQTELKAQVYQLPNGNFELWDGDSNNEPANWNGFPTANCNLSIGCGTAMTTRHEMSTDVRPGTTGSYSCKIFATKVNILIITVTANGNLTTGKINIGSSTASNSSNYNFTETDNPDHSQALNAKPDSIVFWAKFVCPASATQQARMNAVIHDSYNYRDPSGSDSNGANHIVGQATQNFTRGDQTWVRYAVPFDYNGFSATTPEYILISFTTNAVPGAGETTDNLYIDDVELIYNVNLENIFVNGTGIESFDANTADYYVDANCISLDNLITATAASPNANVQITQATEIDPTAVITVTSGDQEKEYRVHITNYMSSDSNISELICEGGSYNFFGQELTETDVYRHTLQNTFGCDSVIVLTLTVVSEYETPVSASICEGEDYTENGFNLTAPASDDYYLTLQSTEGCDSVIVLTLTVNSVYETPVSASICEGEDYTENGFNLTAPTSDDYYLTLQSMEGCDSVIVLTLTVNSVHETPVSATICEGEDYTENGFNLTAPTSDNYYLTLQSTEGCDSVIVLTLTVNSVNTSITLEEDVLTAETEGAEYQWLDCNNEYSIIDGETDRTFAPSETGNYAVEVTQNDCRDISECMEVVITGILANEFENNIKLYPNPSNGEFYVDLGSEYKEVNVVIYDQEGKQVRTEKFDNQQRIKMFLSESAGIYYIELTTDSGEKAMLKVVKTQ